MSHEGETLNGFLLVIVLILNLLFSWQLVSPCVHLRYRILEKHARTDFKFLVQVINPQVFVDVRKRLQIDQKWPRPDKARRE
jgi:hypothetical protein